MWTSHIRKGGMARSGDGSLRGKVALFGRLPPVEWKNLLSTTGGMLILSPGDLKFIPPSGLHLVTGPGVPLRTPTARIPSEV